MDRGKDELILFELFGKFFDWVRCWSQVFLIGVGIIAWIVYRFQKRDQLRTAAIEVKEQIMDIEENLKKLNEKRPDYSNPTLYRLGPILTENLWQKNRSILSSHISEEDRKLIQDFYTSIERIERARADMVKCLTDTWYHKSKLLQDTLWTKYFNGVPQGEKVFHKKWKRFSENEYVFPPNICIGILSDSNCISSLVGTTTYARLSKLSRKWIQIRGNHQ